MGQKKFEEGYQQYEAALALMPAGTMDKIAKGEDSEAAKLHFEAGTCASMAGKFGRRRSTTRWRRRRIGRSRGIRCTWRWCN